VCWLARERLFLVSAHANQRRGERKMMFVVVGTAHLIGKESVIDLLPRKGFKVQQR
jgi:uncharacterized protein YbaP (TraB family)